MHGSGAHFVKRKRHGMAESERTSSLFAILGIVAGVALGAVLVLLFRDRRGGFGGLSAPPYAPVNIWNMPGGGHASYGHGGYGQLPTSQEFASGRRISMETRMKSVQLSPGSANRLFRATGQNPWIIDVSIDGPPGSFAFVSTDVSGLNPGFVGHGNTASIAAGQDRRIRLQPGQDLYGISNVVGVMVSVIATEESLPPSLVDGGYFS